ncbi:MAG: 4Fe-4S binding protein [Chloroflexota bacterium]
MQISRKIVLRFPVRLVDKPMIYHLVKDFGLEFNILKASVTPKEEGLLVMELTGDQQSYDRGISFLADGGVQVQPLTQDIARKEERCTHCGACVTLCPVGAFHVDPSTRRVDFLESKCIACGLCIKACPVRAMEVRL